MHLAYFDENKYTDENPFFYIGGYLLPEGKAIDLENTLTQIQYNFFGSSSLRKDTEFHGKEMFHGKGTFNKRKLAERVQLFEDISTFLVNNQLPIRMVRIDVNAHRAKYAYPTPEYRLGLMLILERFCDYLEKVDDLGAVFGDYEKDEIARAVIDFSDFKVSGKTPMHFGRPLGRLIDTVYFTHSHHSRFLQVADVLIYMAGRYENMHAAPAKWHDVQVFDIWKKIKASTDMVIQHWP
ncbi:MAG: DUF3800 domain-containing protein [Candidatus Thiodiazotropha sp. (ex. Lucinisca nassula)]|nr:DUF3800 domain-containing protein [Candidatus Thiodiazotropha sp. (ex. Lucinisca nassula)]